ncbi:hypothetical protein [Xanthomonas medicagonis]|uniref:hypothetical protein n=1 Tax=Xanthomonas medicagonis TaxID=3160841 RepID=UPI0035169801
MSVGRERITLATVDGLVSRAMALSMQTRKIALLLVMVVAAVVQGCVGFDLLPPNPVSKSIDRNDDADRLREKMQQAERDAVMRVRRMEHACEPPDEPMQRDYAYSMWPM